MADRIDGIIRDFVTGQLDIKIECRKLELAARQSPDNIGGSKAHQNIAPQEALVMKYEADAYLQRLILEREIVALWWACIDDELKNIIILKHKDKCQWWQIGQSLYVDERTARRRYNTFKDMIFAYV